MSNNLQKRYKGHIRELANRICVFECEVASLILGVILFLKFPDKQEGISDILVWSARELITHIVNNFSNLIHENHDFLLQDFCSVSEISDITKSEYSHDLLSSNNWIDASTAFNILSYNLRSSLSIAQCKQSSNLDNCFL